MFKESYHCAASHLFKMFLLVNISHCAAFDTADQNKLLKILYDEIGIHGIAFSWFGSFLLNRTQQVKIGDSYSSENILQFGVPQYLILILDHFIIK